MERTVEKKLPAFVSAYLKKYCLDGWQLEVGKPRNFDNIVVIPAIQEYQNILRLLDSLADNNSEYFDDTLFLFVINNSKAVNDEIKSDNLQTINFLRKIIAKETSNDKLIGKVIEKRLNIGFVDASTEGKELPEKDAGVGLARKIGMDIALNYFDYSSPSKKIIICLDADCIVESDYLTAIANTFKRENMRAAYVKYAHLIPDDENEKLAIICYEIFLRYFLLGLQYANSPFAFPSIGSTIVCDAESYCKVGGMNKRKAAEDFYFLEKLAKITKIFKISGTTVHPSSRGSWRVPFGTGQRVNRYLSKTHEEYLLYDPKSFSILKDWLEIFNSPINTDEKYFLNEAGKIHPQLKIFLEMNSFEESWNKVMKNAKSEGQIQRQKLMWFDGFRTLKLVHYLRDTAFPQINMFDALDEIFRLIKYDKPIKRNESMPPFDVQIQYLNILRDVT